jgi:DNA-binding CsgD family transcriptional regulator
LAAHRSLPQNDLVRHLSDVKERGFVASCSPTERTFQMQRRTKLMLTATVLFATMFIIEQLRSADQFDLWNFMFDLFEMGLMIGAVAMIGFVPAETRDIRFERLELLDDLKIARREGGRWRDAARAHVSGLSQAIAAQFRSWGLTEAEADVAGMMLKGLAHKEIATLRQCSEATVRQHATAVYRKSALTSRSQLTAFFLEDLLMPNTPTPLSGLTLVDSKRG